MPFQVRGECYPDAASALDAWKEQFPSAPDNTGAMWYANAPVINATTGVITGTMKKSTATTTTNITGITLPACNVQTASQIFDKYPMQDIGFAVALTFALLVGFSNGKTVRFF